MTQTEALRMALEVLSSSMYAQPQQHNAITAIKEALANVPTSDTSKERVDETVKQRHEQEPVAVVSGYYGGQCVILPTNPSRIFNSGTALFTKEQL